MTDKPLPSPARVARRYLESLEERPRDPDDVVQEILDDPDHAPDPDTGERPGPTKRLIQRLRRRSGG